ncbi:hypothetical protein KIN20_005427 [Parelaphostrongylus tenuis]|uniref:Uncharacterized protein n=1 Tax=Parelaphostrongylus tenuis TaxID=148309 RepID=A0AAD5M245_PARTN|nr:hypothetical protein KIN20_005427 [Parelaphostrongylus tenuis]
MGMPSALRKEKSPKFNLPNLEEITRVPYCLAGTDDADSPSARSGISQAMAGLLQYSSATSRGSEEGFHSGSDDVAIDNLAYQLYSQFSIRRKS